MSEVLDVLIVGGGPAGACLAALLQRSGARTGTTRVAVLEPARPRLTEPAANGAGTDLRVSAFSRASERILAAAGAWTAIEPRTSPYERMQVWHESVAPRSARALVFDAADIGEPNLGYIIENRLVQVALLDAFEAAGGRIVSAGLEALRIDADRVEVDTASGTLAARLVVGADGARSVVRDAAGLTATAADYGQTAIVANVATERPHEYTAWQRFLAAGTIAFLPLADGTSSIVWSTDDETARVMLAAPPDEFRAELDRISDGVLGATRLTGSRLSFPLKRLSADHYVAERCALIGDAAHVVHPLAGQGMNLGLLDAASLAEVLAPANRDREDPGALRILRRYERWRRAENQTMSVAIDAFNRFLAHDSGPVSYLAQRGLGWVNRSRLAKRFFARRALGLGGELPSLARGVS